MSGGSYNYVCWHSRGLDFHRGDIVAMAARLEGLGYASEVAADTRKVLELLDEAETVAKRLEDVWHDVEWCDSGDCGEERVRKTIAEYQGEYPTRLANARALQTALSAELDGLSEVDAASVMAPFMESPRARQGEGSDE
ncbi:MAG TPA: hypothetical protein VF477_07470 [Mycobacterium sp.]